MSTMSTLRLRLTRVAILTFVAGTALVASPPRPAGATAAGNVTLVSHTPVGPTVGASQASSSPIISDDGNVVVFESTAADLVPGQSDSQITPDVFLFDRVSGTVVLVSHTPGSATTTGNGFSRKPSMSADGAFVAFESLATNLVAGQGGSSGMNVFLFIRATGEIKLVSHGPLQNATTYLGHTPRISRDGNFVAFQSLASSIVAGQNDADSTDSDVFLYERSTGTVTLVSHTSAGPTTSGFGDALSPSISSDGGFVVFQSAATNLITLQTDTNGGSDVFLFTRATGAVTLVSRTPGSIAITANGASTNPEIAGIGYDVVFQSGATNLVSGQSDANGATDVFSFARVSGAVRLVSHSPAGAATTANGTSSLNTPGSIRTNGELVAFQSTATNLVTSQNDTNGGLDVFVFAADTGAVTLASRVPASAVTTGNDQSQFARMSHLDFVVFESEATNLVSGQVDIADSPDVFRYNKISGNTSLVSHTPASVKTAGSGRLPVLNGNGSYVAFSSDAKLALGQAGPTVENVFLYHSSSSATVVADFDGDTDTNVSVYRASQGSQWYVDARRGFQFGTTGDIPVPADYDGDGDADIAVFRPSTGAWYFHGGVGFALAFGTSGDIPVPGDYDADGDADVAVFRPSTGVWFVRFGPTLQFGTSGDIPAPGDYNGIGAVHITVFRPSTGSWYTYNFGPAVPFGTAGDIPVPGDYDSDGDEDRAVFRPSNSVWFVQNGPVEQFGASGDIPVPGDYDGDERTDIAVFRPSNGIWYVKNGPVEQFGTNGDVPLPLPAAIHDPFFP